MDLPLVSACFLGFALVLYMILDGFDLGVGILLLFQPAMACRDHMIDSITPTWDGNETWIIMAGVTLLAAFPIAYSILLPAFYLPVILMLLALGFRGVTFEFRVQSKLHRRSMGRCICSWLARSCIHAGTRSGWPNARSESPRISISREVF